MNNNPLPEGAIAAIKKEANGRFGYSNDSHKKMTDTLIEGAELYHKWIQQEASSKPKEKRAPVQGYNQGIPWDMHLRAYDGYCKRYSKQDALIDLEGRNCRGGFGTEELDMFIPGWREELSERTALIKERDALQQFKNFVHLRLDNMGIPTHPEGEHSKAGCRIGDRLDIVEGMRKGLQALYERANDQEENWRNSEDDDNAEFWAGWKEEILGALKPC